MEESGEILEEIMLPGFRFHPTDEELVGFYLKRKIQQRPLTIELIKQLDIYKYDPWDLPKLATTGEKEWYFYCPRDRKYRNSARPNRVTGAGFWKATGTDRPIYSSEGNKCIGLKKSLVFYKGRAAKGLKTDWMMHEFRLPSLTDSSAPKRFLDKTIPANDSWAICRIFKKTNTTAQRALCSQTWMSPQTNTYSTTHHQLMGSDQNIMSSFTTKTTSADHHLQHYSSTATISPILDHFSSYNKSSHNNNPILASLSPYKPLLHHHHHQLLPNSTISNGVDLSSPAFVFSPLEPSSAPPRCSSSTTVDVSSMLLNMSSSVLGDFGSCRGQQEESIEFGGSYSSSQDHHQCNNNNGFSSLLHQQQEMQQSPEEINMNGMMVMRNDHGGDEQQWIGFPLMSSHEAWKSNLAWDTNSPSPTQMSTTSYPSTKC